MRRTRSVPVRLNDSDAAAIKAADDLGVDSFNFNVSFDDGDKGDETGELNAPYERFLILIIRLALDQ